MALKTYKCMNLGNCTNADAAKTFDLVDVGNPGCPECGSTSLIQVKSGRRVPLAYLVTLVALIAGLGAGGWYMFGRTPPEEVAGLPEARILEEVAGALGALYEKEQLAAGEDARLIEELARKYGLAAAVVGQMSTDARAKEDDFRGRMQRAISLAARNEFAGAATELEDLVKARPGNAWTLANLCTAYWRLGRRADARGACDRAMQTGHDVWLAHYNAASLEAAEGRVDAAVRQLEMAVKFANGGGPGGMTPSRLLQYMKTDADLSALKGHPAFGRLFEADQ